MTTEQKEDDMFKLKLSTKHFFVLVALLAAVGMVIGCGSGNPLRTDDGITWDDGGTDTPSGRTPVISVLKTETTRAGKTELSYHFEADMEVENDLVVALQIQSGSVSEGAIYVMREGEDVSEAFSFGDEVTQVVIMPHKDLLDFEVTKMAPINSGSTSVDLSRYPMQNRRYTVSTDNASVTR